MTPDRLSRELVRAAPLLRRGQTVGEAVENLRESGLPALPVIDESDRLLGIFGEHEFMGALFPGYFKQLGYAGFVPSTLDDALEKRSDCRLEAVGNHLQTEHVDVPSDFSDAQLAETFLHHHVLIVPVVDAGKVRGVITRHDFFARLAERFLEHQ